MNPRLLLVLALLAGGAVFLALRSGPSDAATETLDPSAPERIVADADVGTTDLEGDDVASNGEGQARSAAPQGTAGVDDDPDASPVPRTFEGRVLDPLGNGVAGARVELIGEGSGGLLSLNVFDGNSRTVVAETDILGHFQITAETQDASPLIRVLAHGFRILETTAEGTDLGNLSLERGAVLTGFVLSADGAPVPGARVTRSDDHEGRGMLSVTIDAPLGAPAGCRRGGIREGSTVTADDGSFELPHEPAGAFRLAAQHESHPKAVVRGEVAEGAISEQRIRFERAGVLEGVLVGFPPEQRTQLRIRTRRVDGEPSQAGDGIRIPGLTNSDHNTTLDKDGSFVLEGLVLGATYEVWATEELGGFWESETCSDVQTATVPHTGLVLQFVPGGRLQFQVVDAKTLEPVTSLHVHDEWEGSGLPSLDFGNAAKPKDHPGGRVTLAPLRPPGGAGSLRLSVRAPGYRTHETTVSVGELADLDLGTIHLTPTARIVFRVQDTEGAPVDGARVSLFDHDHAGMTIVDGGDLEDEPEGGVFITTSISFRSDEGGESGVVTSLGGGGLLVKGLTDATGTCGIELPDEDVVRLKVHHKGFAPYEVQDFPLPRVGQHEETIVLNRGGRALVTVYDSRGGVVPKARIEHHESGGAHVTDAAGEVHLEFLPPGRHHFRLPPRTARPDGIIVFDGGSTEDADLTDWTEVLIHEDEVAHVALTQAPQALLRGRITQRGKALKRASLLLVANDEDQEQAQFAGTHLETGTAKDRTNLRGDYAFAPVDAGTYTLVVRHPDRQMAERREIVLGEGERTWDLDLGLSSVRGRIVNEAGEPVVGARVSAQPVAPDGTARAVRVVSNLGGMSEAGVTTDTDGRYELLGVASDVPISIHAKIDGLVPANSSPFEVPDDQERSGVDLVLEVGATLIVTHADDPEAFRFLNATHEDGTTQVEQAIGESTTLEGMQAGVWTLQIHDVNGGEPIQEEVTLQQGVETSIVLDGEPD